MVGKTSIPSPQVPKTLDHSLLYSRNMGEKMIQMETIQTVHLEEIGGKVHFIIRALPS